MEPDLRRVYLLSTEESGDYIFSLSGVVVVMEHQHQFHVYCPSAQHNLYRAALQRHQWEDLVHGVRFRGVEFRLEDLTREMAQHGWTQSSAIPRILRHLYESNQRQLFFLERHLVHD